MDGMRRLDNDRAKEWFSEWSAQRRQSGLKHVASDVCQKCSCVRRFERFQDFGCAVGNVVDDISLGRVSVLELDEQPVEVRPKRRLHVLERVLVELIA